MVLGVLALQGDVREHAAAIESLGERVRLVRQPDDVEGIAGLLIPGGESTTLSLLLESSGLFDPLAAALSDGLPAFGTCAGMILLAERVLDGRDDQRAFGAIDLTIRRNGYGRQAASFECELPVAGLGEDPVHAVFIRAPVVEDAGPDVEVLATLPEGRPVVCRQGPVLTTAFHPELTGDRRLHQLFVEMTKESV
jgi:pyridoxal 5'-phosphate synthase pdxT subunit